MVDHCNNILAMSRGARTLRTRLVAVRLAGAASGADLGGSSKYLVELSPKTEVEKGSMGTVVGHG